MAAPNIRGRPFPIGLAIGPAAPGIATRCARLLDAVSDIYRPRYEQVLQAELEGRHWWPADNCRPNGFVRSGWSIRYFMMDPTMVVLSFVDPLNQDRYVFTDGRGFLPEQNAVPQWMGESQGFWDGDELVIWTKTSSRTTAATACRSTATCCS